MSYTPRVTHLKPEGAYAVLGRAQELEAQGRDIIHLEVGQPDFDTFPHISQAGIQAIQDGHTRYNPPAVLPGLRREIARSASQRFTSKSQGNPKSFPIRIPTVVEMSCFSRRKDFFVSIIESRLSGSVRPLPGKVL